MHIAVDRDGRVRLGWRCYHPLVTGTAALTLRLIRCLAIFRSVRAELAASGADALIDYRSIGDTAESAAARFGPPNSGLDQFEADGNHRLKRSHDEGAEIRLPMLRFNEGGRRVRAGRYTVPLPLPTRFGHAHGAPVLDAIDTMLFG